MGICPRSWEWRSRSRKAAEEQVQGGSIRDPDTVLGVAVFGFRVSFLK